MPSDPVPGMLLEVLNYHFGLLRDIVRVQAQEPCKRPRRSLALDFRIILTRLDQPIIVP